MSTLDEFMKQYGHGSAAQGAPARQDSAQAAAGKAPTSLESFMRQYGSQAPKPVTAAPAAAAQITPPAAPAVSYAEQMARQFAETKKREGEAAKAKEDGPVRIKPPAAPLMPAEQQRAEQFAETKRREGEAAAESGFSLDGWIAGLTGEKDREKAEEKTPAEPFMPLSDSWRLWNLDEPERAEKDGPPKEEKPELPKEEDREQAEEDKRRAELEERHKALTAELDEIEANAGYITDPDAANAAQKRKSEIITELYGIDAELESPARFYDEASRLGATLTGAAQEQGAGYLTAGGLALSLAGEQDETGRAIADSAYAGYATDPLSEANMRAAVEQGVAPDSIGVLEENERLAEGLYGAADKLAEESAVNLGRAKEGLTGFDALAVDLTKGAADLAGDALASLIAPGSGMAAMATRIFGNAAAEVRRDGGSVDKQLLAGLKAAGIEVLTEKIAGPFEKIYGRSFTGRAISRALDSLDNPVIAKALSMASDALGEGAEEILSDVLNPIADRLLKLDDGTGSIFKDTTLSQVLYDGLVGAILGMFGSAVKVEGGTVTGETIAEAEQQAVSAAAQAMDRAAQPASGALQETDRQEQMTEPAQILADQAAPKNETPAPAPGRNVEEQRAAIEEEGKAEAEKSPADLLAETATGEENAAEADESTAVNTDPDEHTPVEQAVIDDYQASVDEDLVEFVNEVQGGKKNGRYWLKPVTDRAAQAIKDLTGVDVSGNRTAIEARSVEHILNRHGENGQADHSMRDVNDIGRIQYVLDNYDSVTEGGTSSAYVSRDGNGKHRPAKTVIFAKKVNGTYYAVEAVPDTAKNTLYIVSAYMNEKGSVTQAPNAQGPGNTSDTSLASPPQKEGNPSPSVHAEALRETSETAATSDSYLHTEGDPSTANIAQRDGSVNAESVESGNGSESRQTPADEREGISAPGTISEKFNTGSDALNTAQNAEAQTQGAGRERERGFAKNVRSTEGTDTSLAESLETDKETYRQLANKDVLQKAESIFSQGLEAARGELEQAIGAAKAGSKLSPEMVPLSRMVANELARNGDTATAHRLIADVATELTAAGELGQVGKLLRNADPATALNSIQKAIDGVNKEIEKRYGKTYKWRAKLTEAEIEQINRTDFTKEGAYEEVYEQIAKRLGAEMPSTLWEKIAEVRRVNMLLRPRTQIKNVLSNMPMIPLRKAAEKLSGAIQDVLVKTGALDQAEQTRSGRVSRETRDLAKQYVAEHKAEILEGGNKADMDTLLNKHRTIFKDGPASRWLSKATGAEVHNFLESARRLTYDLLEKGDTPFVLAAYQDSLAQICEARGVTSAEDITREMMDFAFANAMEATYKAASVTAQGLNAIKRNGGPIGKALDVMMPFTTTPMNIFSLMRKYSPVGIFDVFRKACREGDAAGAVDAASKATVGTATILLGIGLRALGAARIGKGDDEDKDLWDKTLDMVGITGAQDKNKNKAAFDRARGINAYSFGGRWSYDWAEPYGSLLSFGAEIYDCCARNESFLDMALNVIYTSGDAALNMSIFQNITKMLKGYGSNTEAFFEALIEGGATQLISGLAGDIAKILDPTVRSTYTGGNALDTAWARVMNMIPGLSRKLPANVDVFGEDMQRGNRLERAFDALINPGISNRNEGNEITDILAELYERTGSYKIFPVVAPYSIGGDKLTGEERAQYQRTAGHTYRGLVSELVFGDAWEGMNDDEKATAVEAIRDFSNDEAKMGLAEEKGEKYESSWAKPRALLDVGINVGEYTVAKKQADTDGSGRLTQDEVYEWLLGSAYTDEQRAAVWDTFGYTGKNSATWADYLASLASKKK